MTDQPSSRLLLSHAVRLGAAGLIARPTRAVLSALGIAAMIAVVGISTSSQAELNAQLDAQGTNLLQATQGQDFFGDTVDLPLTTRGSAARVDGVEAAATTGLIPDMGVYRSNRIPKGNTNGIGVMTASPEVLDVVGGAVGRGTWFTDGTAAHPPPRRPWFAGGRAARHHKARASRHHR